MEKVSDVPYENLRLKEDMNRYPDGLFVYGATKNSFSRVEDILQQTLTGHRVIVSCSGYSGMLDTHFPTDLAMQIGSELIGYHRNLHSLKRVLAKKIGIEVSTVERLFGMQYSGEDDTIANIEGGLVVPVLGTSDIYITESPWNQHGKDTYWAKLDYLKRHHYNPIDVPRLAEAYKKKSNFWSRDPDEWIGEPHIDLIMTAFRNLRGRNNSLYIDADLLSYAESNGLVDNELKNAKPFDHRCTLEGGLNIKYISTGGQFIALVPTLQSIYPMEGELRNSGWQIVELGADQVVDGGGVKCRSLDLKWPSIL